MLCRERYVNTLSFRPSDRIPLIEWPIRQSTRQAWELQGYPPGMSVQEFFGLDTSCIGVGVNVAMHPRFEEKIIEQDAHYKIWQDGLGAIRKDFLTDATPGFVTRTWLRFPVETREDFLTMTKRYDSTAPARFPADWPLKAAVLNAAIWRMNA